MTTIILKDGSSVATDDRTSSAFVDYDNDVIWVGGGRGWLHKITPAFRATPAEVTTGGFPLQVNQTNPTDLSSPVYDSRSRSVFVGDAGGFFYRVSVTGVVTVTATKQLDFGTGLFAGPIVDGTTGRVYVFSSSDGTKNCAGLPCAAVYQFAATFPANAAGNKAVVGTSQVAPPRPNPLFAGGFDANYFSSGNATGNLYVCGNTGGVPRLYRIPINAGTMGPAVTGPALSSVTTGCSPVTDISNPNAAGGTKEWIFASAQASGLGNKCAAGGCAMNFVDTPWLPSHAYAVGQQVLDPSFNVQTCSTAGTSRTAALGQPAWNATVGGLTPDAGAQWVNQGPHAAAHGAWQANHAYQLADSIIDTNGNIQVVTTPGTSRTAAQGHPTWATSPSNITNDRAVRWSNAGLPATASLPASGGSGGIIVDNIVGSGTMAGASQIYFSTQSNQACGTTGTGGCAVQASQSGLQ